MPETITEDPLSNAAVIGIGITAIIVFAVLTVAAMCYCRWVYRNPITPAGVASPGMDGATNLPGIKTLDQLNSLQDENAGAGVRGSVEMHSMGRAGGGAGAGGRLTSISVVPTGGAGAAGVQTVPAQRHASVELAPISPKSAAAVNVVTAKPAPAGTVPILAAPPLSRQSSDVPPIEQLPFVRLSSESQTNQPLTSIPAPGVLSRSSSEQNVSASSDALPPMGALPALARGDSLQAVLVASANPRLACPKCSSANAEGTAFCAKCGYFFTK